MTNVTPTVDVGRLSNFPSSQPELILLKEFHSPELIPLHCAKLWEARIKSLPGRVTAIFTGYLLPACTATVSTHTTAQVTWNTFRQPNSQFIIHPAPISSAAILSWNNTRNTGHSVHLSTILRLCKAPLDTDEGTTSHQLEKNLHPGMMALASNPVLRRWKQDDPGQPLLHRKGKATLGYVKLHFKK